MNTKIKIYIIAVFFALLSLFLLLFFVFPSLKKIISNSEDLFLRKRNIAVFKTQATEVENFKKNYDNYALNLEKIDKLFIDLNNPAGFIEFLEKTASESGIKSEISLSSYSLKEEETSISFQFFSTGDLLNILKFTKELESGPYLVEITNLSIKNSESEGLANKGGFVKNVDAAFLIKAFTEL